MTTVETLRHMARNYAYAARRGDLEAAASELEQKQIYLDAALKRLGENDEEIKMLRENLGRALERDGV